MPDRRPAGALALHPVRRLAQHSGLEREPVGPAPIVRRSTPVSSSQASAATCAARVPAVSPNGSGPANRATIRAVVIAAFKDAGYLHIPEGRRDHTTPAETLRLHGLD